MRTKRDRERSAHALICNRLIAGCFLPDVPSIGGRLGGRLILMLGWSTRQIVVAYRSQWEVEAAFRQMKDYEHAAFRPIYHWTDQKIRVHALYGVASLMLVNLAWRGADRRAWAFHRTRSWRLWRPSRK